MAENTFRNPFRFFLLSSLFLSSVYAFAADPPVPHHDMANMGQQAAPAQEQHDEAWRGRMRQAQDKLWKEERFNPTPMARSIFEAELRGGRVSDQLLQAERGYIRAAREAQQLRTEFDRHPTRELATRLAEAEQRRDASMSDMHSPLHGPIMEAVGQELHDSRGGMRPDKLAKHLQELGNEFPNDPSVHRILGRSLMKDGRFGEAIREFTRALSLDPKDITALKARSIANQRMGDYEAAKRDALDILSQDPNDAAALAMIKLTAGRSNPSEGAGTSVRIPVSPENPEQPAGSQSASGEPETAVSARSPSTVINVDPIRVQSDRLAKESAHDLDMKDWQKAVDDAARAIAANANNAQAYYYQAVAYVQLLQYDLAVQAAEQGLTISPDDRVLLDAKATALNRAGKHGEARLAADRALARTDKKDAQAWFNVAFAGAGLGASRGEILDALGRASQLDPAFAPAFETARIAPRDQDLRYLFNAGAVGPSAVVSREAAPMSAPGGTDRRFWLIVLATVVGGLLMALGFLHVFAPEVSRRLYGPSGAPMKIATALVAGGDRSLEGLVVPGTYQVIRKIGAGGMGTVYEALDLSLRRRVAIKMMRSEIRDDPRERRRFIEEAQSVAALKHPGIVQIFSIEEKPELFLVFEYVDGKTLDRMLAEKGKLEFSEALRILGSACDALQYAHSSNVVHRDLKPSNIMVSSAGVVKVMDFGVARQVKDAVSRMMTNTICGTPSYMAPEIEQGIVSREADVYSLGICLYELISGDLPFAGTGAGLLLNKMNMNYRPLASRVKGLPRGIDAVLEKALQPESSKRYASPGDFKAALDALSA